MHNGIWRETEVPIFLELTLAPKCASLTVLYWGFVSLKLPSTETRRVGTVRLQEKNNRGGRFTCDENRQYSVRAEAVAIISKNKRYS